MPVRCTVYALVHDSTRAGQGSFEPSKHRAESGKEEVGVGSGRWEHEKCRHGLLAAAHEQQL